VKEVKTPTIIGSIENIITIDDNSTNSAPVQTPNSKLTAKQVKTPSTETIGNILTKEELVKTINELLSDKFKNFERRMKSIEKKIDEKLVKLDQNISTIVNERLTKFEEDVIKKIDEALDNQNEILGNLETKLNGFSDKFYTKSEVDNLVKAARESSLLNDTEFIQRINMLESQSYKNDLILNNIPVLRDESLSEIFLKICNAVGVDPTNLMPPKLFRLKSSTIIIKFNCSNSRNLFFTCYLKKLNLCLKDIGLESLKRIYISESTSKYTRELFKEAIKLKNEGLLYKVYIRNSSVFIITKDKEPPVLVVHKNQLLSLKTTETTDSSVQSNQANI
jgi:hypothetical protein